MHIVEEPSIILKIKNKTEHAKALALLEEIIEDYDKHEALINLLCVSIEKYEDSAEEFTDFNERLKQLN